MTLDGEAYALLSRQRRAEESFSDTVQRLARPRRPISSFAGVWKDMSASERKMLDQTYAELQKADRRRAERIRKSCG